MKLKTKSLRIFQSLIGFLLLASPTAVAQPAWCQCFSWDNWYVAGDVALGWHNNTKFSNTQDSVTFEYEAGFGSAYAFGVYICPFRLEIEASFRRNDLDKATVPAADGSSSKNIVDGSLSYASLMFDAYYDYFFNDTWAAYLGGGIGITWARFSVKRETFAGEDFGKHTNAQFAWQGKAGIVYEHNCRVSSYLGYRIFGTHGVSANHARSDRVALLHNIETGIRLTL